MTKANGLLNQKLRHYLNQGRTLNDIINEGRTWNGYYFDLSKLNLANVLASVRILTAMVTEVI